MPLPHYSTQANRTLSSVLAAALIPLITTAPIILVGGEDDASLEIGTVLGRILFGEPEIAVHAGNTGTGILGGGKLQRAAKPGNYVLTCMDDAGRFQVVDPDGFRLADALAGSDYIAAQIAFTLSNGETAFGAGDSFTITVPKGSQKLTPLNPQAEDGSQIASAILAAPVTVPAGCDTETVAIVSHALVLDSGLVWPDDMTADEHAAALDQMAARFIFTRTGI